MVQVYPLLQWSGGVILAAIVVMLFILDLWRTFRDRIQDTIRNVLAPKAPRLPLALASLSNSIVTKDSTGS